MDAKRMTKAELVRLLALRDEEIAQLKDKLTVSNATVDLNSSLNKLARDYSIRHHTTTRVAHGKIEAYVDGSWKTLNPGELS